MCGVLFATLRTVTGSPWYAHDATYDVMPVRDEAPMTTRALDRLARQVLPGATVRRLLFWRYLLVWHKPPG
ncbi:hypothetical protein [Mycobacterium sp. M26]|uniref:hypothetical protein n=1 Tax=Mycobacterium sp. M26 TaxID=1762962 RepID=UPI00073F9DC7|nr:hypothetical protein [Mycobacterium sp. M26]